MEFRMSDIQAFMSEIKRKAGTELYSNYNGQFTEKETPVLNLFQAEDAIVFVVEVNCIQYAYFYGYNQDHIRSFLKKTLPDTVIEYISRADDYLDKMLFGTGFQKYAVFKRLIDPGLADFFDEHKNTYGDIFQRFIKEGNQERDFYAGPDDLEDILQLLHTTLDKYVSHFPERKALLQYIENRWVLLYKEKGKIIALHIYRIEGRKYNSNFTINKGAFYTVYSLLAKALKDALAAGATYGYCWVKDDNIKSLRYCGSKGFYPDGVKNIIYRKEI